MILTETAFLWSGFLVLLVASWVDIRTQQIPNNLVLISAIWGFLGLWILQLPLWTHVQMMALIMIATGLIRGLGWMLYGKAGLGMGDIKLFGMIALFAGEDVWIVLYGAVVSAGFFALIGLLTKKLSRNDRLPFAPFMAIGYILAMVYKYWQMDDDFYF